MHDELISIVVPVYQAEKGIRRCLESILCQTYTNLQIIVIDDGSTDDSGMICDSYTVLDSRIEVVHTKNQGSVCARQEGLNRAKGEYIGFVDSDDYIRKDLFEVLHNSISEYDADFVHSWYITESLGKRWQEVSPYKRDYNICSVKDREILFEELFFDDETKLTPSMWSKLYKAEFIKGLFSILPEKQCFGEDYILLFLCLSNCKKVRIVNESKYIYVNNDSSLSHIDDYELLNNCVKLFSAILELNDSLHIPHDKNLINLWLRKELAGILQRTCLYTKKTGGIRYHIADIEKYRNKRIIIYGAGSVGLDYLYQIKSCNMDKPVAIIDQAKQYLMWDEFIVFPPEEIASFEFDIIIIAVYRKKNANEIRNELIMNGVPYEKIAWEKPVR